MPSGVSASRTRPAPGVGYVVTARPTGNAARYDALVDARRTWLVRRAAIITVLYLVVGCATGPRGEVAGREGPVIDGWPIAEVAACDGRNPSCEDLFSAARGALDKRDGPFQPAIVSTTLYYLGEGAPIRTTGNTVAVFTMTDGTRRAIFVSGSMPLPVLTLDFGP
jgi:hypothetical protein